MLHKIDLGTGKQVGGPIPSDCNGIKTLGWTQNGFYLVKGNVRSDQGQSSTRISIVYCDFNTNTIAEEAEEEKFIGYVDVKPTGVYFQARRESGSFAASSECLNSPSSEGLVIPYQMEEGEFDGLLSNINSGVFTVPTNGRYFFSFTARSHVSNTLVQLRVNRLAIAASEGRFEYHNMPISTTVNLEKGDTVDVFLKKGAIFDSENDHQTVFTGILLEEDLIF